MKKTLSWIILSLFSFQLMANSITLQTEQGSEVEFGPHEMSQVAQKLDEEANATEDQETKKLLKRVSAQFKVRSEEIQSESKIQKGMTKFGRKLGKGSVFLATHTSKPFMRASAFFTGFFEKADKNQDVVALYNIFLKNDHLFKNLYKEVETPQEFAEAVVDVFGEVLIEKSQIIMKDVYRSLNPTLVVPENLYDLDLEEILENVDYDSLDPRIVNEHPEFQDLKPFIGDLSKEDLFEIIQVGGFVDGLEIESFEKALPKIHEMAVTAFVQSIGSTIVLSSISGALGAIYAVPVLLADVGAAISVGICISKDTQQRMLQDDELGQFCSYVTNWSSYQLMKSRMKGYVKGKKVKAKYLAWTKKMKDQRKARKEKRESKRANKA